MGRYIRAFLVSVAFLIVGVSAGAEPGTAGERVSCSNERYEDFMNLRHQKDKLERERQRYVGEIKALRAEEKAREERARREFHREKKVDDLRAEREWVEQQKADRLAREEGRRRYVEERERIAANRCRGLKIPELKEYELEDY